VRYKARVEAIFLATLSLIACSFLALLGASTLASALYREQRAERAMAALLGAAALVIVPTHALAWLGLVTRSSVLGATCGLAAAIAIAGHWMGTPITRSLATAYDLFRLPVDAMILAWRGRHIAGLGVLAVVMVALWTTWLAYIIASTAWDGLWYHEAIVGYTLQLGGAAEAAVGDQHHFINGYPKLGEYLQLWSVVAGEREWIDGVSTVMGILLLLATYVLITRFVNTRLSAVGYACAIVLVPGVALQFRSSLIDVSMAAFAACSMCFATRPVLRTHDVIMGALSLGLLAGTKATGVLLAALYGTLLAVRVVHGAVRDRRWLAHGGRLVAALAIVLLLGAPSYARNFVRHGNPIWPLAYSSKTLGMAIQGNKQAVPYDRPWREVLGSLVSLPEPGKETHDTRDNGYGNVMPFTVLPLALLGGLLLLYRALRALVRREALDAAELNLLALFATAVIAAAMVPAIWWGRLHVHLVVVALATCAWLLRGERLRWLSSLLIAALIVGQLTTLAISRPGWGSRTLQGALDHAAKPRSERRVLDHGANGRMRTAVARAFENEIGPGDLVATDGGYLFIANLWNRSFSNHVRYEACPAQGSLSTLAQQSGAKWVIAGRKPCIKSIRKDAAIWEEVGPVNRDSIAFRRREEKQAR
jgi:hypothetical protein